MPFKTVVNDNNRPIIVWVGDDFTGSAATMEVLSFAGISSILFLGIPTPNQAKAFDKIRSFGIATLARSKKPAWMEANLPLFFEVIKGANAELYHYKTCSTLDSSPQIGSIGKACEIGLNLFGGANVPVVTAAPQMGRFQIFGNLFCTFSAKVHRLDRHPVMSCHPVTPMNEADVARHLALQTKLPTRCLNVLDLQNLPSAMENISDGSHGGICTLDMQQESDEIAVGKLLWENRETNRFVVGSQGIEYALVSYFQSRKSLPKIELPAGLPKMATMAVVSGSVSPTTADQIDWAEENGFSNIRVDTVLLCNKAKRAAEVLRVVQEAANAVSNGLSPLIFTARGPNDPAITRLRAAHKDLEEANIMIGQGLGRILRALISREGVSRVAVSGGDTSGHVCSELGIFALEAIAPTIPGAAICRAHSEDSYDGLEIALKGGQMGSVDYFGWVRDGGGARP